MQGFTYDELTAALQSWPEEDADEFLDDLPRIIQLGELRLVRELNLDIFDTVTNPLLTVTGNNRALEKPEDLITTRSVFVVIGSQSYPVYLRSREFCEHFAPDITRLGRPRYYYEHSESEWRLVPTPNANMEARVFYVARPEGLSEENQNTWLGDRCGDLLFDCCLMEVEHWVKADDRYEDIKTKFYAEKLPAARLELRNIIRAGDSYSPYKPSAKKAE